jgi:hypothetical protein
MEFESILYAVQHRAATTAVNRPDQLNALHPPATGDVRGHGQPHALTEELRLQSRYR